MPESPHRIRTQRWLVRTASASEAFAWRGFLREHGSDLLLPPLERLFEETVGSERFVYLPRLEVKLKVDSMERLPELLSEAVLGQLREQLSPMLQAQAVPTGQPLAWEESSAATNRFEIFLHYLRRGWLPWPLAHGSAAQQAQVLTETCRREWGQLVDYLRTRPESATFYFRLLQLIAPEEAFALVEALAGAGSPGLGAALAQVLRHLFDPGKSFFKRHTQLRLTAAFLAEAGLGTTGTASPPLEELAQQELSPEELRAWREFVSRLPEAAAVWFQSGRAARGDAGQAAITKGDGGLEVLPGPGSATGFSFAGENPAEPPGSIADLASATPGPDDLQPLGADLGPPATPDVEPGADRTGEMERQMSPAALPGSLRPPGTQLPGRDGSPVGGAILKALEAGEQSTTIVPPAVEAQGHRSLAEGLFPLLVSQAGLVLLHPFLPRFFKNTALVQEGDSQLAPSALERGAALLYFLATGREEPYEYELGLIKVLLGLHPEFPLPVGAGLVQPADGEEAETLLQSAIAHWGALRNTSVSGLRSTFLERQGLLRDEGDFWKLHVEQGPFDVLLDRLPWSIGIVRLPWMKEAVYTEW